MQAYDTIADYHHTTKHHFHRYARSAGNMDWANQPSPFRFFTNTRRISLPFSDHAPLMPYGRLHAPLAEPASPFGVGTISSFFLYALGLSAWKSDGANRWPLRINPSSGNLHPTEAYLIAPDLPGLRAGVYHYAPFEHKLEQRALLPDALAGRLNHHFNGQGVWVALSSIFWRESWKYGERAFRYCQLDVGHALAALAFAARLHGWRMTCVNAAGDELTGALLGFDRTTWRPLEEEVPEVLCRVSALVEEEDGLWENNSFSSAGIVFEGQPNPLSAHPFDWSLITRAARATFKPPTPAVIHFPMRSHTAFPAPVNLSAAAVLRQRRSAQNYNPDQTIPSASLFAVLERTLPADAPPFGVRLMPPGVDLLLFMHRVSDLAPGLYLLARRAEAVEVLRSCLDSRFIWRPVGCDLPLYLLEEGDKTYEAMTLSCHQEIAGRSALAVAMLADFETPVRRQPYVYRHLHWECGMIGQVLYLEAEALGLRGTGIGCFFDDEVHKLLGLSDLSHQVLYHFTLGHAIEDRRLSTLAPYHHIGVS